MRSYILIINKFNNDTRYVHGYLNMRNTIATNSLNFFNRLILTVFISLKTLKSYRTALTLHTCKSVNYMLCNVEA